VPFVHEQNRSETIKKALFEFANAISIDPSDMGQCCEHIIRSIETGSWPKGLDVIISQLTSIGIETGLLEPQVHADAISSFKRWRQAGWQIIVLSQLSTRAQQLLLTHAQAPELIEQVHQIHSTGNSPECVKTSLMELAKNKQGLLTWVTCQTDWIEPGLQAGYRCFYLDRQFSTMNQASQPMSNIIMDLSLIDLLINS